MLSYRAYPVGQRNLRQGRTIFKSIVVYHGYTVWQHNFGQGRTSFKRVVVYGGYAIGQNQLRNFLQPLNAELPIVFTPAGISTPIRLAQFSNIPAEIIPTDSGMEISCNAPQPPNA